ncbi:MAG: sugar ABC transporter permease [Solirubrobacteraceae bacterium]
MDDPTPTTETGLQPRAPAVVIEDLTAAPDSDEAVLNATSEILASSLGEFARAWWVKTRSGESGALPIIIGLILIIIFFRIESSVFLSAGNLVNLLVEAAVYILLGAAEIFALVLSEIDLSVGFVSAIGGMLIAELIAPPVSLPWWLGIIGGLGACALIGLLQGTVITRLHVPSFVVTLAGLLVWEGALIELANVDKTAVGGVMDLDSSSPIYKLVNSNMSPALGWILLVVVLALFAVTTLASAARKRKQGLSAPPLSITLATIAVTAVGGIVLVYICNLDRGLLISLKGVPYVVPFVGLVLFAWSVLLGKTRLGRYIYAIGANPEAARRAGINVARVRTIAFVLCSFTAGMAGMVYLSRLGSISIGYDGGGIVLYAVAAAVIGGASLFGGRGKPLHALLGGIVIATVFNGLDLIGITTWGVDVATGVVLLLAATVDATLRRRGSTGAL